MKQKSNLTPELLVLTLQDHDIVAASGKMVKFSGYLDDGWGESTRIYYDGNEEYYPEEEGYFY